MRQPWPVVVLILFGCGPSDIEQAQTRAYDTARVQRAFEAITVTPDLGGLRYAIQLRPLTEKHLGVGVTWTDGSVRSPLVHRGWSPEGGETMSAPIGLDPGRANRVVLRSNLAQERTFPIRVPTMAAGWTEKTPLRGRSGPWTISLTAVRTEQLGYRIDGPPLAPGVGRAMDTNILGRFDRGSMPAGALPFEMTPDGRLEGTFERGLLRPGDRVRIFGEIVEGAIDDRSVPLRMNVEGNRHWTRTTLETEPTVAFEDHTFRIGPAHAWTPGESVLTVRVTPKLSTARAVFFYESRNGTSEFRRIIMEPAQASAMASVEPVPDGFPTRATLTLRRLGIEKRTRFDFLVAVPPLPQ